MDKRVIFATAGSGKTTYIVEKLNEYDRSLIITYTNANYSNLFNKILIKFDGKWPENIELMTYFSFLFRFCYKPFLSDKYSAKGIIYEKNLNKYAKQDTIQYYLSNNRFLYSNRITLLLENEKLLGEIRDRIKKYFDVFIIDEVQDIAGRDFTFLEHLSTIEMNMLFVGDFYQHTFNTSRDGNVNGLLFDNKTTYESRFKKINFCVDNTTLTKSWRCSKNICDYIRENIGIEIYSNRSEFDNTSIEFVTNADRIKQILEDEKIVKLHYQNSSKNGANHRNWGDTKGEDNYHDVCVLLNNTTAEKRKQSKLFELPQTTKNKLYVAITRARGNIYLVDE